MVKVYFGCAIRGGTPNVTREEIAHIAHEIKDLGHSLMSEHAVSKGVIDSEKTKKNIFIHDRDYAWMKKADVGIFEISNPSLGVGAEISDMIKLKKPVLCLYKRGLDNNVSAYIIGKQGSKFVKTPFICHEYHSLGEAKYYVKRFVEKEVRKN